MPKKYIGKKYENSTWYDMYYDDELKMISLIEENDKDLEFFYNSRVEDTVAMSVSKELYRVEKIREAKEYKESLKKNILTNLYIFLFIMLGTISASKLKEPTIQYNVKYVVTCEDDRDELAIDYISRVIDENRTISSDFKKYLMNFFHELDDMGCSFNIVTMNRIFDNIKNKNFQDLSFENSEGFIIGLAEVISDKSDVSVLMTSLEYYEHYYDIEPSSESRLFDAINIRTDNSLLNGIIAKGDLYYNEYLCRKYGIVEEKANRIINFLKYAYTYDEYNYGKLDNYTNSILAFNYNFGGDFLIGLDVNTSYCDFANGNTKYSYNLFDNIIKLTISNGSITYDTYYDTLYGVDITSWEYYKKFEKLLSNFDGNIDINDENSRMLLYLYTIASLSQIEQDDLGENFHLFRLGEYYFGNIFYSFLSGNECDISAVGTMIVDLATLKNLDEDDLILLNEALVCLNKERECGRIEPYLYEYIFKEVSICINSQFDKKTFLEWQDNIISLVEPESVSEIINKHRTIISQLTKSEK
ncbi:MAG: hypothetical protein J5982_05210 [Bacilli bacterium]|nr:hypothetical protein [Bacilli bacterium]